MKFHFILVDPKVPENVGFVCRALKTMGHSELYIVNSNTHTRPGAKNTSYNSKEILDGIKAFDTLEAAIEKLDFVIGTSAKGRAKHKELVVPNQLKPLLISKSGTLENIGVVFGGEESGLSNEHLEVCDILSHIPMKVEQPSLNLSHSVMIYAYELSQIEFESNVVRDKNESKIQKEVILRSNSALESLDVPSQPVLFNRLQEKIAMCSAEDSKLILSLLRHVNRFIKSDSNAKKKIN